VDNVSSIEFSSGDLAKAFHGTYNTHISGQKNDSGSWDVEVNVIDYYDFKWGTTYQDEYQNNLSILNLGAKSVTVSQSQGVVSNYFIDVSFSDTIK